MATPYYVSQVDGNDSYNGLYPTFISGSDGPWLTISKADNLSGSQSDNSVLFNRGGTWREQYALECYGISGHPFTVGAYGTGNKPKIYGSDQLTGWTVYSGNIWQATTSINPNKSIYFVNTDGSVKWGTKQANADACDAEYEFFSNGTTMYCYALTDPDSRYTSVEVPTRAYCIGATGQSYITIDGLDIRHFTDNGIRIYTDAVYNTVQNCQISYGGESVSGAGQGIIIRGSYHQIIGNTIHDCSIHGIRTSTASGKTTSNITISENEVYDCYHSLIDLSNGNATGVSTDHTVTRNFLYTTSNYAYPSTLDCNGIYVAGASADQQNIEISYNVIINIFAAAIQIQNNVVNCNIYNNTCYGTNPVNNWSWTSGISIGGSGSSGIAVKNNIAANFYSGAGGGDSCFGCSNSAFMSSVDNNCWYQATGGRIFAHINTTNYYSGDFVAYKAATGWDTHGKWEDPKFVNAGGATAEDYKLTATSPCRDTGVNVGLTQDYWGNSVPIGGSPDIGIYEYQGTGGEPEINITDGTNIIGDGGTFAYGSKNYGTNTDQIFTLENLGDVNLTLSGTPIITITGTNANQFSCTSQPTTPIAGSAHVHFTLRFSPTSPGAKVAAIAIGNNDTDENPYNIALTGTALAVTYYVDKNAAAGGDGTTQELTGAHCAWDTIADVNVASFLAGDSALIARGTPAPVYREQLNPPSSGSAGLPITFGAYGTGDAPIIDGADILSTWAVATGDEETGGTFACGFESETSAFTTQFTAKVEANSNTIDITTAAGTFNSGLTGAIFTYAGTAGFGTTAYKNAGTTSSYARFYFKLNSAFASAAAGLKRLYLGGIRNNAWSTLAGFWLEADSGQTAQFHLVGGYRYPGTGWTDVFTGANNTIALNTWYYIEVYYQKAVSATIQFWLDGVSQGSVTAINTNTYAPNGVDLGISYTVTNTMTPAAGSIVYFDDVKLATTAIGAVSLPSYTNTYFATVSTATNQIFRDDTRPVKGASSSTLNDHEWYGSGGRVWYRDDSGTPQGAGYTLTASQRTNNIALGKNHVTVDSLDLRKANMDGLYFSDDTNNNIVSNNTVSYAYNVGIKGVSSKTITANTITANTVHHNGASGVVFKTANVTSNTIQNNTIYRNSIIATTDNDHEYGGGVYLWTVGTGNIVQNNISYRNGYDDTDTGVGGNRGGGLWFDTVAAGNIMRYNKVYNNQHYGLHFECTSGCQMYYNISYGDNVTGIRVGSYNGIAVTDGNAIYNNVTYGNDNYGFFLTGYSDSSAGRFTNNIFKNNVSVGNGTQQLYAQYGAENDGTMGSGNVYTHNCLGAEAADFILWGTGVTPDTYDAWEALYGSSTFSVESDPLLTDPATGDFTLQSTSPCINAGVDVGLTQDYEGNAVIGFPDIGAQEYGLGVASDYLENKLLDHVFKVASFSVPTNLYIALCKATVEDDDTGSTLPSEVSGGSYARKRCNTWTAASVGGTLSNNMAIQFVEASATWGTVTDFAVVDSGSGGNMLVYGKLSYAKRVLSGDIFKFATNDLDVAVN